MFYADDAFKFCLVSKCHQPSSTFCAKDIKERYYKKIGLNTDNLKSISMNLPASVQPAVLFHVKDWGWLFNSFKKKPTN